jgi:branched-chain amino acid transport system substrate-binding protein
VGPIVTRLGGIFIDSTAQGNQLTGADCQAGYYRATASAAIYSEIVGVALESAPAKTWSIIVADYAFGNDMAAGVQAQIEDAGQTVDQVIKAPLGNADYGSAISQLADAGSQGLFTALPGADAATFLKQAAQFGILGSYQTVIGDALLTNLPAADFQTIAAQMPAGTLEIAQPYYPLDLQSETSDAYVKLFEDAYPADEAIEFARKATTGWNAMQVLLTAVHTAGSQEPDDVRKALDGLTLDLPQGPATMRADDHQLLVPGAIGELANEGGTFRLAQVEHLDSEDITPEPDPACKF